MPTLDTLKEFAALVAALFIVLDPLAIVPIFATISRHADERETRSTIFHVVIGATILLLFFTITGTWVLNLFGVTLNDLRVGGGLLLLIIAFRLVMEGSIAAPGKNYDNEAEYRAAIIPIISPLLIGPGAITAAVVLAAIHGVVMTALAGIVVMLISMILFFATRFIYRLLGAAGTDLMTRVVGVLVATIAISYIREGISGFLRSTR